MKETEVTVVGNVVNPPQKNRTASGSVTNFRLASTSYRYDRETQGWVDKKQLFIDVECWGELGGNVSHTLSKGDPVVVIPAGALLQTGDQAAVWVVSPDKVVQRRPVKVLRFDAETVTIQEGLKSGDLVVTNGINSLAEGQKVGLPPGVAQ